MNRVSTIAIQMVALVVVAIGCVEAAEANSMDDCYLYVFQTSGVQYLEWRKGYSKCAPDPCTGSPNNCKVRLINVGGVKQYCSCKARHQGDGCVLAYSGTGTSGGTASCLNLCGSSGGNCPPVNFVPHPQQATIAWAVPCQPCQ